MKKTVAALHIHRLMFFRRSLKLVFYLIINNNVEQQGVVERCSFEQGLCSWAESDVDTPGAEWTGRKGQDAWPEHGPPRDHTQNSAAGIRLSELLGIEMILVGLNDLTSYVVNVL